MTAAEALRAARDAGVVVKLNGDKLKVEAVIPPPPVVLEALRLNKADIIELLKSPPVAPWDDAEEERAAVIEFDGGAPRLWAEALARLDPAKPPGDVPERRWVQFIDDCGLFLDGGWAARAERLGWGPPQLFGCHRDKPFARISQAGLLWIVEGRTISELTADAATITTASGGHLTFRRKQLEAGGIPVWELDR
jgi:hypothetical protein